jgi:ADP-glucose pyrophosphorylase
MMGFWTGFFSVFNLFPETRSYDEIKEEVDQLYIKRVSSSEFLEEMIKLVPSGNFQPYAYYNEDMDSIQVYFKDTMSYTQPLNNNIELHLCHDTNEIVGANILRVKKLLNKEYLK